MRSWFDRRLSKASDWPVVPLLEAKQAQTVAVVLPALNEAATVGQIVERIHRDLLVRRPLIDELVVMDSGSTDATPSVAADAGARVVHREDLLADFPPYEGKGEVLWRSLAATTSDVVVFVDSDLRDFSTTFVTGLLGPLLTDDTVQFVKATYDRPMQSGAPAGGGRVTELVARPLINMYWPELAGFIQPLGGEYAARRGLLEQLPFPTGYGVEFGLLIDALATVGLDAMAQVDLVRRKHRNSSVQKLGRMAAEIMQVALDRLEREGRLEATGPPCTSLTQFERDAATYRVLVTDVTEHERPAMRSVRRDLPAESFATGAV